MARTLVEAIITRRWRQVLVSDQSSLISFSDVTY